MTRPPATVSAGDGQRKHESVVERGRDRLGQDERADTLVGTADRRVHQAQTSQRLGRREVDAHRDAVTQRPRVEARPESDQEARRGMHGGPGDQGHAASKVDSRSAPARLSATRPASGVTSTADPWT